jgi:hypothetical protein
MQTKWITTKQAAALLGVDPTGVHRLAREAGIQPYMPSPALCLWPEEEIVKIKPKGLGWRRGQTGGRKK